MRTITNTRREKLFGAGRPRPMDRNAKARLMALARALMRRTERGKHYGPLTAKAVAALPAKMACGCTGFFGLSTN